MNRHIYWPIRWVTKEELKEMYSMDRNTELELSGAEIIAPDCRNCGSTFEECDCGRYEPKELTDYLQDEGAI